MSHDDGLTPAQRSFLQSRGAVDACVKPSFDGVPVVHFSARAPLDVVQKEAVVAWHKLHRKPVRQALQVTE